MSGLTFAKEFSLGNRVGSQMTPFTCSSGFVSIIRASQVLRKGRVRVSRCSQNTEGRETSRTPQLGFRHKIMMFRGSQMMFAHLSIGPSSAALRLHGRVCGGGANFNPSHQLCFTGAGSLVCVSEGIWSHSDGLVLFLAYSDLFAPVFSSQVLFKSRLYFISDDCLPKRSCTKIIRKHFKYQGV